MALAGTVPAGAFFTLGQMHNLNLARHYSGLQQTGHIGCHHMITKLSPMYAAVRII